MTTFTGTDGDDTLTGGIGNDTINGLGGNDTISGGAGDDSLNGGDGNDTIHGDAGNDTIDGGTGTDSIDGGDGNDSITANGDSGSWLMGGLGDDVITASSGVYQIFGDEGGTSGTDGNDHITLTVGGDGSWIAGGGGDDVISASGTGSITVDAGFGTDSVTIQGYSSGNVNVGEPAFVGDGDDVLNLPDGYFTVNLGAGRETIHVTDTGAGFTTVMGFDAGEQGDVLDLSAFGSNPFGTGALTFTQNGPDVYIDSASGMRFVLQNVNVANLSEYNLGLPNPDYHPVGLTIAGQSDDPTLASPDVLVGADGDDVINAYGGDDALHGSGGNDLLDGGLGNDIIDGGSGIDTATYADSTAAVAVNLSLSDAQDTGGAGSDTLVSIENLIGSKFNDTLTGDAGANHLTGGDGNDTLTGGAGDDYLDGGAGDDVLSGGAGTNTASYLSSAAGVHVSLAITAAQNTIGAGSDTLTSIAILEGSNFNDVLTSASAGNTLHGEGGNDHLIGGAGSDTLDGGAGNDTVDGGAGNDRLIGGTGDDTYRVDSYNDSIVENAGEGNDSVIATASYKLSANVENLTLSGSGDLYGYGNELDNQLTGNSGTNKMFGLAGDDVLNGGTGADRMFGGLGDDRYYVDNYSDRVIENAGEGTDSVFSAVNYKLAANVEKLTLSGTADIWGYGSDGDNVLTGNAGANKLYGLGGSDTLSGGGGNDWLEGGAGQDRLSGGAGSDSFVFRDGDFGGATAATADRIIDFSQGEDKIRLNSVDADTTLTGDQAFHFLGTAAFDGHAGELRYEAISGNTYLSGDTNGDGIADFMIRVDGLHTLTSGDLVL